MRTALTFSCQRSAAGFTLAELAIVLVIVALLTSGMLMSLGAQQSAQAIRDTEARMAMINEALLGFAAAHGRLPCPATATSNGLEDPVTGGACTAPHGGFVPAATLGIAPVDAQGYAIDAWNQRIRYAVTNWTDPVATQTPFTITGGIAAAWGDATTRLRPDLHVCSAGPATGNQCPASATLTDKAAAVIYSTGANFSTGGIGIDESQNPNPRTPLAADRVFVSHPPTAAGAANGEFDDLVLWLSPNILYNRMIAAGRLP